MPYDENLDARIRKAISGWKRTSSRKMFGGVCHLLAGNMFCGVYKDFLILRLGETGAGKAMALDPVRPFDITGRPMKGWVMVEGNTIRSESDLAAWLLKARRFTETLPPKRK